MRTVARQAFWNLPNSLTMARIAVIPVVMILMLFPGRFMCQVAMWLFIAACITDIVDGFLDARFERVDAYLGTIAQIKGAGRPTLSMLTVAVNELGPLCG